MKETIKIDVKMTRDIMGKHVIYITNIPDFKVSMQDADNATIIFELDATRFTLPSVSVQ